MPAVLRLKRRSKYRNLIQQTPDGIFHSRAEYARWQELKQLQAAEKISGLLRQVTFKLYGWRKKVVGEFVADFIYNEIDTSNGEYNLIPVVEDFKGVKTPVYNLKKRLLAAQGVVIRETGVKRKGKR